MPNLTPIEDKQQRLEQYVLCEFRQEVSDSFAELRELIDRTRQEIFEAREQLVEEASELVPTVPRQSHYTPAEAAELLGRSAYTVREWCRLQRIHATKRPTGRGDSCEWEIAHEEVERIKSHGLLPPPQRY